MQALERSLSFCLEKGDCLIQAFIIARMTKLGFPSARFYRLAPVRSPRLSVMGICLTLCICTAQAQLSSKTLVQYQVDLKHARENHDQSAEAQALSSLATVSKSIGQTSNALEFD